MVRPSKRRLKRVSACSILLVALSLRFVSGFSSSHRPRGCFLDDDPDDESTARSVQCSTTTTTAPYDCRLVGNDDDNLEGGSGIPLLGAADPDIPVVATSASSTTSNIREGPVQRCGCAMLMLFTDSTTDLYCPVPATDVCFTRRRNPTTPLDYRCYRHPDRLQEFSRSVWPFCCVMVILIASCLVCTHHGNRALCCVMGHLGGAGGESSPWMRWYATYLLERHPRFARRLMRLWISRRRAVLEERLRTVESSRRLRWRVEEEIVQDTLVTRERRSVPRKVFLKTKRFNAKEWCCGGAEEGMERGLVPAMALDGGLADHDDDEADMFDDVPTCSICYGPLQDGDRVGDLPCRHVFHKECLKVWIQRRNVCPLCLDRDIAKDTRARATGNEDETEEETDHNDTVESTDHEDNQITDETNSSGDDRRESEEPVSTRGHRIRDERESGELSQLNPEEEPTDHRNDRLGIETEDGGQLDARNEQEEPTRVDI